MKKLFLLSTLLLATNGLLAMEKEEGLKKPNLHRLIAEVEEMLPAEMAEKYDAQIVQVCERLASNNGAKKAIERRAKRSAGAEVEGEAVSDDKDILQQGLGAALALLHDKVDLASFQERVDQAISHAAASVKVGTNKADDFIKNLLQDLGAKAFDNPEQFKAIYEGFDKVTDEVDDVAEAADEAIAGCCGFSRNRNEN